MNKQFSDFLNYMYQYNLRYSRHIFKIHRRGTGIDFYYWIYVSSQSLCVSCIRIGFIKNFHFRALYIHLIVRRKNPSGYQLKGYDRADESPSTYNLFLTKRLMTCATIVDIRVREICLRKEEDTAIAYVFRHSPIDFLMRHLNYIT